MREVELRAISEERGIVLVSEGAGEGRETGARRGARRSSRWRSAEARFIAPKAPRGFDMPKWLSRATAWRRAAPPREAPVVWVGAVGTTLRSLRRKSPWLIFTAARAADGTEGRSGVERGAWVPPRATRPCG